MLPKKGKKRRTKVPRNPTVTDDHKTRCSQHNQHSELDQRSKARRKKKSSLSSRKSVRQSDSLSGETLLSTPARCCQHHDAVSRDIPSDGVGELHGALLVGKKKSGQTSSEEKGGSLLLMHFSYFGPILSGGGAQRIPH